MVSISYFILPIKSRFKINSTIDFGIIPALNIAVECRCSSLPPTHSIPYLCPSSNPPSVLGGISLSSQPEQVQDLFARFGLAPLGSAFSFQYQLTFRPSRPSLHIYPD
jgi:hypothetical protein